MPAGSCPRGSLPDHRRPATSSTSSTPAGSRSTTSITTTAIWGRSRFPSLPIRGLVADPATATLFVAYGGPGGSAGTGSMLAYDLVSGRTLWRRNYSTGVDNIAITPNGRKIYMAVGEASEQQHVGDRRPGQRPDHGLDRGRLGPARDDRRARRQVRLSRRREHPVPRGRQHIDGPDREEGRAAVWARRPAVHDQRDPDAGVHDILELPWLSGQQHQDGKGALQRFSARVSVRRSSVRQHPRPRHLALPRRTSALPDRHAERVRACLRRQRPPASGPP